MAKLIPTRKASGLAALLVTVFMLPNQVANAAETITMPTEQKTVCNEYTDTFTVTARVVAYPNEWAANPPCRWLLLGGRGVGLQA